MSLSESFFEIKGECAFLKVRVATKSSKNAIVGVRNGELLISVTAVPENGKANEAIMKLLSKSLKCAKSKIELISGSKSKNKLFKIGEVLNFSELIKNLESK